jgi:hypothetical protein
MKNEHLFLSESGDLYDTRLHNWADKPIRAQHARTHRTIRTGLQLRQTLRAGPYAWPGGYPVVLTTSDGEMVHPGALTKDKGALYRALYDIRTKVSGRIVGADIYYEGDDVQCAYTNETISSAYGPVTECAE